jgi:hypothetical protein
MWRLKENEEKYDDDECVAAAGFIFLTSHVSEYKQEPPLGEANTE